MRKGETPIKRRSFFLILLCLLLLVVGCSEVDPYLVQPDGEWPDLTTTIPVEIEESSPTTTIPSEVFITPPTTSNSEEEEKEYLYKVDEEMSSIVPLDDKKKFKESYLPLMMCRLKIHLSF